MSVDSLAAEAAELFGWHVVVFWLEYREDDCTAARCHQRLSSAAAEPNKERWA